MKPNLAISIFIITQWFLPITGISQNINPEEKVVRFKLEVASTQDPVAFSYVGNARTGIGNETKENGSFNMTVAPGDSLLFRSLGYQDTSWVISQELMALDTIHLCVEKKSYTIDEVNVYWFKSYASFKQKFLSLSLPPEKKVKMNFTIDVKELNALAKAESGTFGFSSNISGGSWKSKQQREYDAFLNEEQRQARLKTLTSHENLKAFTGFEGTRLDSFVVFLRKHYTIDPELTNYKIMETVQVAYEDFLALLE
jgi:hypothetical protein